MRYHDHQDTRLTPAKIADYLMPNRNLKVSTWEKSFILRKRRGWEVGELVAFLNRKGVTQTSISVEAYALWENGAAKAPQKTAARIDDLITLELYRTQSPA
ncbi:MAG: hypothetical protein JWM16_4423 [Verrucomicrobiales bacterium]|nr:hypothetical protein [Verrucomicrobiales bacterium]